LQLAAVFLGRLNQEFTLAGIMAERFFDVNVLAGRATQDRRRRMPVIARGDDEDIDVAVVEDAPEIGDHARRLVIVQRSHESGGPLRAALVDVANISDLDAGLPLKGLGQAGAAAAGAHDADA
jgi:hypothetical protein